MGGNSVRTDIICPFGSKLSPLSADPFPEVAMRTGRQTDITKMCHPCSKLQGVSWQSIFFFWQKEYAQVLVSRLEGCACPGEVGNPQHDLNGVN